MAKKSKVQRRRGDFLDEMIAERTKTNPGFPKLVDKALAERRAKSKAIEAQKAGKVWLEVTVRGGSVPSCNLPDAHPIGTLKMSGAISPLGAFHVWMAVKGLDPLEIAEEVASFMKPGGEKQSRMGAPGSLRKMLEMLRDMRSADVETLPPDLRELRSAWLSAGLPGV